MIWLSTVRAAATGEGGWRARRPKSASRSATTPWGPTSTLVSRHWKCCSGMAADTPRSKLPSGRLIRRASTTRQMPVTRRWIGLVRCRPVSGRSRSIGKKSPSAQLSRACGFTFGPSTTVAVGSADRMPVFSASRHRWSWISAVAIRNTCRHWRAGPGRAVRCCAPQAGDARRCQSQTDPSRIGAAAMGGMGRGSGPASGLSTGCVTRSNSAATAGGMNRLRPPYKWRSPWWCCWLT